MIQTSTPKNIYTYTHEKVKTYKHTHRHTCTQTQKNTYTDTHIKDITYKHLHKYRFSRYTHTQIHPNTVNNYY